MRLKLVELNLRCPIEISPLGLRPWIKAQLQDYGEPLRWAITATQSGIDQNSFRELRIEAVLIMIE